MINNKSDFFMKVLATAAVVGTLAGGAMEVNAAAMHQAFAPGDLDSMAAAGAVTIPNPAIPWVLDDNLTYFADVVITATSILGAPEGIGIVDTGGRAATLTLDGETNIASVAASAGSLVINGNGDLNVTGAIGGGNFAGLTITGNGIRNFGGLITSNGNVSITGGVAAGLLTVTGITTTNGANINVVSDAKGITLAGPLSANGALTLDGTNAGAGSLIGGNRTLTAVGLVTVTGATAAAHWVLGNITSTGAGIILTAGKAGNIIVNGNANASTVLTIDGDNNATTTTVTGTTNAATLAISNASNVILTGAIIVGNGGMNAAGAGTRTFGTITSAGLVGVVAGNGANGWVGGVGANAGHVTFNGAVDSGGVLALTAGNAGAVVAGNLGGAAGNILTKGAAGINFTGTTVNIKSGNGSSASAAINGTNGGAVTLGTVGANASNIISVGAITITSGNGGAGSVVDNGAAGRAGDIVISGTTTSGNGFGPGNGVLTIAPGTAGASNNTIGGRAGDVDLFGAVIVSGAAPGNAGAVINAGNAGAASLNIDGIRGANISLTAALTVVQGNIAITAGNSAAGNAGHNGGAGGNVAFTELVIATNGSITAIPGTKNIAANSGAGGNITFTKGFTLTAAGNTFTVADSGANSGNVIIRGDTKGAIVLTAGNTITQIKNGAADIAIGGTIDGHGDNEGVLEVITDNTGKNIAFNAGSKIGNGHPLLALIVTAGAANANASAGGNITFGDITKTKALDINAGIGGNGVGANAGKGAGGITFTSALTVGADGITIGSATGGAAAAGPGNTGNAGASSVVNFAEAVTSDGEVNIVAAHGTDASATANGGAATEVNFGSTLQIAAGNNMIVNAGDGGNGNGAFSGGRGSYMYFEGLVTMVNGTITATPGSAGVAGNAGTHGRAGAMKFAGGIDFSGNAAGHLIINGAGNGGVIVGGHLTGTDAATVALFVADGYLDFDSAAGAIEVTGNIVGNGGNEGTVTTGGNSAVTFKGNIGSGGKAIKNILVNAINTTTFEGTVDANGAITLGVGANAAFQNTVTTANDVHVNTGTATFTHNTIGVGNLVFDAAGTMQFTSTAAGINVTQPIIDVGVVGTVTVDATLGNVTFAEVVAAKNINFTMGTKIINLASGAVLEGGGDAVFTLNSAAPGTVNLGGDLDMRNAASATVNVVGNAPGNYVVSTGGGDIKVPLATGKIAVNKVAGSIITWDVVTNKSVNVAPAGGGGGGGGGAPSTPAPDSGSDSDSGGNSGGSSGGSSAPQNITQLVLNGHVDSNIIQHMNSLIAPEISSSSAQALFAQIGNVDDNSSQQRLDAALLTNQILLFSRGGDQAAGADEASLVVEQWTPSVQSEQTATAATQAQASQQVIQAVGSAAVANIASRMDNISPAVSVSPAPGLSPKATPSASGVNSGDELDLQLGVWMTGFGGSAKQKRLKGNSGYGSKIFGGSLGADSALNDNILFGAAVTYADTKVKHKGAAYSGDTTKSKLWMGSVYGIYVFENNVFARGIVSYGNNKIKTAAIRTIGFDTKANTQVKAVARGKYESRSISTEVGLGYRYNIAENVFLTPSLGVQYNHTTDGSYTEAGAGNYVNKLGKRKYDQWNGVFGVGVGSILNQDSGVVIMPELHTTYSRRLGGKNPNVVSKMVGFDQISTKLDAPVKDQYSAGLGVTVRNGMTDIGIGGDVDIAKKYLGYRGSVKLRVNF